MFSNIQMKITKQFHPVINFITFYGRFSLNKALAEERDENKIKGFIATGLRVKLDA